MFRFLPGGRSDFLTIYNISRHFRHENFKISKKWSVGGKSLLKMPGEK